MATPQEQRFKDSLPSLKNAPAPTEIPQYRTLSTDSFDTRFFSAQRIIRPNTIKIVEYFQSLRTSVKVAASGRHIKLKSP